MFVPPGDNPAAAFLRQTDERDPIQLFSCYAHHLLDSADCWALPISLEKIRKRHHLKLHRESLDRQRGLLFGRTIIINNDDLETVQAFSQAHELMETLTVALRDEGLIRFPPKVRTRFELEKENWCELGAAELLMPKKLFFPLAEQHGVSLASARLLANHCQTSFTATVRRLLDVGAQPCLFALLKEGHRKHQVVPSKVGQGVFWGKPEDWDPPAELRVWKWWRASQVGVRLYTNESLSRATTVYETFQHGVTGIVRNGYDLLDFEDIKGRYFTESMLVTIDDSPVVMMMVRF